MHTRCLKSISCSCYWPSGSSLHLKGTHITLVNGRAQTSEAKRYRTLAYHEDIYAPRQLILLL
jgi:hypothetical protein